MTQQSIVDRLGSQEQAVKICREATCLVDLGRKVNADYVAQARIGRFSGDLTIKVELYRVGNGALLGSFIDNSKDVLGLLAILETKAPALFSRMLSISSEPAPVAPAPVIAPDSIDNRVRNSLREQREKADSDTTYDENSKKFVDAREWKRPPKEQEILEEQKPLREGLRFGVRAGFNLNNFSFGYKDWDEGIEKGFGVGAGLALKVPLASIVRLNVGLDFYMRSLYIGIAGYDNETFSEYAISIPVLFQFGNSIYLATGMQLDIPLGSDFSESRDVGSRYVSISMNRSSADIGFVLGLGYMVYNIGLDFKYVYGLTGLFDDISYISYNYYGIGDGMGTDKDKSWLGQYCFGVSYFF
jgi:hypothetical protein